MLLPFAGKVPRDEGGCPGPNATGSVMRCWGRAPRSRYGVVLCGDDGPLTLGENTMRRICGAPL